MTHSPESEHRDTSALRNTGSGRSEGDEQAAVTHSQLDTVSMFVPVRVALALLCLLLETCSRLDGVVAQLTSHVPLGRR